MNININEKKLEKYILEGLKDDTLKGKHQLLGGVNYKVGDIAKDIIKKSPEIRKIIENKVKELMDDGKFLKEVIKEAIIFELKPYEPDND